MYNVNIWILIVSTVVSGIGTGISIIGIPWVVQARTGSTSLISLYLIVAYIGLIFVLPNFSTTIDRYSRKAMAIVLFGCGFVVQIAVLVAWLATLNVTALMISGIVSIMLRSLDQVNRMTLGQALIEPSGYRRLNQWLEISRQAITLVAGGVAAVIFKFGGLVAIIAFDATTYLASVITMLFITVPPTGRRIAGVASLRAPAPLNLEPVDKPVSKQPTMLADFVAAIGYARQDKILFFYLTATLAPMVAVVAQNAIYPAHFERFLGASAEAYALHALVYGIGAIMAASMTGLRERFFARSMFIKACFVLYTLAITLIVLVPLLWVTYACIFIFALCSASIRVERATLIMGLFDQAYMGRINGLFEAITTAANILLVVVAGLMTDYVSLAAGWLVFVAIIAVGGVAVFVLNPLGHRARV